MHLNLDMTNQLNTLFQRQIHIYSSLDIHRLNAIGIAFILNKSTTRWAESFFHKIIPERAAILEIPWQNDKPMSCLNAYAPNDFKENKVF